MAISIAHLELGTVWLFSALAEPIARIRFCAGLLTTNVAYGAPDRRTLYITESESGQIRRAKLDVPGRRMFSHG
jgi:gluconolactonase